MNKDFLKFKKKMNRQVVLAVGAFGIALGTLIASAFTILWKLEEEADVTKALVIGVSVAMLVSILLYILKKPTDKRVAKKLDEELGLNEKVQTMVEFASEETEMIKLQREDTQRILAGISTKSIKSKRVWKHFITPLLACALLATAIVIPAKADEYVPKVDPNYTMTPWQTQALKDLIEEVKASGMDDKPKGEMVTSLEKLLEKLPKINKKSAMQAEVVATISELYEVVENFNTYSTYGKALSGSINIKLGQLGTAINKLNAEDVSSNLAETLIEVANKDKLNDYIESFKTALATVEIKEGDPVRNALDNFVKELENAKGGKPEDISAAFLKAADKLDVILIKQRTNAEVRKSTIFRLMQIFGIEDSQVSSEILNNLVSTSQGEGDYEDEEDDDKPLHGGGLGSGEMVYGSDDMIYDPELDKYVTYGEVINKYYAKITEQIVDGNLSAKQEQLLVDYFAFLFNGYESDVD